MLNDGGHVGVVGMNLIQNNDLVIAQLRIAPRQPRAAHTLEKFMAGKFALSTGKNGEFYFNLKAGNGEVILTSEGYTTTAARDNGIESVRKNGGDAARFNKATASDGRFYFTLKAGNAQVIGKSQMYKSESGRDGGIESVMANAVTASIADA